MAFKRKEILLLTLLLVVTVSINLTFIILIESSRVGDTQTRVLASLSGYNQLDVLSPNVLNEQFSIDASKLRKGSSSTSSSKSIDLLRISPIKPEPVIPDTSANIRTMTYRSAAGDIPFTIDYAKETITVNGYTFPIIKDGDVKIINPSIKGTDAWVIIPYDRFDIYVDDVFYSANQAALDDLFNKFEPRYEMMESITGWRSEDSYGQKLKIYVNSQSNGCWSGSSVPGNATINIRADFTTNLNCKKWYFTEFNGTIGQYGSPGELGDYWYPMAGMLHESLHAINPLPILMRRWLTEGFSQYYQYNVLVNYNGNGFTDVNQDTADTHIYFGNSNWHWDGYGYTNPGYIGNNYRDTTSNNLEIQSSQGYDITAWMYSMMRDNHNMDWVEFYGILNNNQDTLDATFSLAASSVYYTDTYLIDVFGRASGLDFETQTKLIWRYDGPSGPGWGVRNWENTSEVYSDFVPFLSFSSPTPTVGNNVSLIASVYNNGGTNSDNVSVRFYNDTTLVDEKFINILANSNTIVNTSFRATVSGNYSISIIVDENNMKIESNDSNNIASGNVTFVPYSGGHSCGYVRKYENGRWRYVYRCT